MPQTSSRCKRHGIVFGFAALFFLFPLSVAAIPLSAYQQNLKNAITALDTLYEMDEEEGTYANQFNETIEGIRTSLPKQQTVELGSDVCNVDNEWLHNYLDDIPKLEDPSEVIRQTLEKLKAIEERVSERLAATGLVDSKEQAKSKLENILARPEYATGARGPNALTRFVQDFLRWLQKILPKRQTMEPGRAVSISQVVQIIVVVLALAVLAYVAKILLTRFKRSKKYKAPRKREARIVLGERLEPEETATNLLAEAEALARRGELRTAIRKAYIALLVELGDRKVISLAQHKTNRDYLRGLSDAPQLYSRMRGLTDSFERHWYGFAEASESDWQDFRAGYLDALQTGK
jgi:hypothetical protein